jgi:5-methylcytosine-specific restriction endonuclease McrA
MKVLVLNNDYQPLNVTNLRRGFKLVIKGKAEVIKSFGKDIKTGMNTIKRPSVIRLLKYVYTPFKRVELSRKNIYRRDGHKCVYCGDDKKLTLDHVLPKSRGGKNTWANLVTCCARCNVTKSDSTPEEANMTMSQKPFRPTFFGFIKMFTNINESWRPFIFV